VKGVVSLEPHILIGGEAFTVVLFILNYGHVLPMYKVLVVGPKACLMLCIFMSAININLAKPVFGFKLCHELYTSSLQLIAVGDLIDHPVLIGQSAAKILPISQSHPRPH
jgi:riboflavin transporter FmnP